MTHGKRNKFGGNSNLNRAHDTSRRRHVTSREEQEAEAFGRRDDKMNHLVSHVKHGPASAPLNGRRSIQLTPREYDMVGLAAQRVGLDEKEAALVYRVARGKDARYNRKAVAAGQIRSVRVMSVQRLEKMLRKYQQSAMVKFTVLQRIRKPFTHYESKNVIAEASVAYRFAPKKCQLAVAEACKEEEPGVQVFIKGVPHVKVLRVPALWRYTDLNLPDLPPGSWKLNGKVVSIQEIGGNCESTLAFTPAGKGGSKSSSVFLENVNEFSEPQLSTRPNLQTPPGYGTDEEPEVQEPKRFFKSDQGLTWRVAMDQDAEVDKYPFSGVTMGQLQQDPEGYAPVVLSVCGVWKWGGVADLEILTEWLHVIQQVLNAVVLVNGQRVDIIRDGIEWDDDGNDVSLERHVEGGGGKLIELIRSLREFARSLPDYTNHREHFTLLFGDPLCSVEIPKSATPAQVVDVVRKFFPCVLVNVRGNPIMDAHVDESQDWPSHVYLRGIGQGGKGKNKNAPPPLPPKPKKFQIKTVVLKKKAPKKKTGGKDVKINKPGGAASNAWFNALRDSFNPAGMGCRLPGDNRVITSTFKKMGTFTCSTTGGSQTVGLSCSPNPFIAVIDNNEWLGRVGSVTNPAMVGYGANTYISECCRNWSAEVRNGRIVNACWKIRLLTPTNQVTGRLFIAPIPCLEFPFGYQSLEFRTINPTSEAARQVLGGYTPEACASSGILNTPGARELALADMVGKDLIIRACPISDEIFGFKSFRASQMTYNSTTNEAAGALFDPLTGLLYTNSADNPDAGRLGSGWNGFALWAEGLPEDQPIFDIEWIYTFEGQPRISDPTEPVPTGQQPAVMYSRAVMDQVLGMAANVNWLDMIKGGAVVTYNIMNRMKGF